MALLDEEDDDDEDFVLDWDELMGTNYEELATGGAEMLECSANPLGRPHGLR